MENSEEKFDPFGEEIKERKEKVKEFHRARTMFCIKDGKVEVAPKGIIYGHAEWFVEENWTTEEDVESLLKQNVRGLYLPEQNSLYCYKGSDFSFDDELLSEIIDKILELKQSFNLNDDTEIHLGPKDSPIGGTEYQRVFIGTLKELINKK